VADLVKVDPPGVLDVAMMGAFPPLAGVDTGAFVLDAEAAVGFERSVVGLLLGLSE
jgi:hypothetical protein